jgi:hypothetical protein
MTVTTLEKGYLEGEYLEDAYLTGLAEASAGMQVELNISDFPKNLGMQALFSIANFLVHTAQQAEFKIADFPDGQGFQARFVVTTQNDVGMQALFNIVDQFKDAGMQAELFIDASAEQGQQADLTIKSDKPIGMQAQFDIVDFLKSSGMEAELFVVGDQASAQEVRIDKYPTLICGPGYLEAGYLEDPYLVQINCLVPGMQVEMKITDFPGLVGMQANLQIVDKLNNTGMQAELTIVDVLKSIGMQFDSVIGQGVGMQVLATLYNTTNLRILCEFPSRGLNDTNWTANTTATGDFSVQNLDTDIVEQKYRSATGNITGVRVQSDTGLPQGVFLDTFALLNHNMTRSASVTLIGSNDPTFAVIGISTVLEPREDNIYYIAPTLPLEGFRYWRVDIDDATNTDGYIEIGTILFGASNIFQGECFVDELDFQLQDFADTVRTEGFTNVSNSRALKRKVRLEFRFLNFQKSNFKILRNLFETYRTTQKCLWIPTPSPTDSDLTGRFASFAKLSDIPSERHRYLGGDADYVSFTIEVDESL